MRPSCLGFFSVWYLIGRYVEQTSTQSGMSKQFHPETERLNVEIKSPVYEIFLFCLYLNMKYAPIIQSRFATCLSVRKYGKVWRHAN